MSLGNSIRHGTAWIMTGKLGGRALDFVFGVVLARLLVPDDFGLLVTVQIFTGVAGFFAVGGMGQALVQAKEVAPSDYRVVFTLQAAICGFIYAVFWFLSPWVAVWFDNPLYTDLMRVSALAFLTRPFINVQRAQLARAMRYKAISIVRFSAMVVSGIASIVMAFQDMGPWALVLGGVFGSVTSVLLYTLTTRWYPGIHFDTEVTKRLGGFGMRMTINNIINYLRNQTSNLIISKVLGASMVGLYNKADSLSLLPASIIAGSAHETVFRGMSSVQDNLDKSKYLFLRTIALVTVYTLPFYVGLWWVAQDFIVIVYGQHWALAATPLQILSLAGLFRCISISAGATIAAQNRLGTEMRIQIEAWVLTGIGAFVGTQWGINGVAWGLLPGLFYLSIRLSGLARSIVGVSFMEMLAALAPGVLLNTILFAVLLGTDRALDALDITHSAIYLLTLIITGGISYALLLLFLPIKSLESESSRWRKRLGLI